VKADAETRERLIEAAEKLFAQQGFKRVTVRAICRAARANVAAVNYHFGDKIGLYREVMQSAIDAMRGTNDAAREAGAGRSPEEQLRRYIAIFVHRVLTPDEAEGILERGEADAVTLVRALIADPEWGAKARAAARLPAPRGPRKR